MHFIVPKVIDDTKKIHIIVKSICTYITFSFQNLKTNRIYQKLFFYKYIPFPFSHCVLLVCFINYKYWKFSIFYPVSPNIPLDNTKDNLQCLIIKHFYF